jgi:hypothetical protein
MQTCNVQHDETEQKENQQVIQLHTKNEQD